MARLLVVLLFVILVAGSIYSWACLIGILVLRVTTGGPHLAWPIYAMIGLCCVVSPWCAYSILRDSRSHS